MLDVTGSLLQCLLGHALGLPRLLQCLPHCLGCAPHSLCLRPAARRQGLSIAWAGGSWKDCVFTSLGSPGPLGILQQLPSLMHVTGCLLQDGIHAGQAVHPCLDLLGQAVDLVRCSGE